MHLPFLPHKHFFKKVTSTAIKKLVYRKSFECLTTSFKVHYNDEYMRYMRTIGNCVFCYKSFLKIVKKTFLYENWKIPDLPCLRRVSHTSVLFQANCLCQYKITKALLIKATCLHKNYKFHIKRFLPTLSYQEIFLQGVVQTSNICVLKCKALATKSTFFTKVRTTGHAK